jgi:hypothetical protein
MNDLAQSVRSANDTMSKPQIFGTNSLRGVELATLLHERGQQKEALRVLVELVHDIQSHPMVEPWMVFEVLALKTRILVALGHHQRANAIARPALHWLCDAREG